MVVDHCGGEDVVWVEIVEVGGSGEEASDPTDDVFHAAFLPRGVGVAEEGFDGQTVVLGELGPVVEGEGSLSGLGEWPQQLGDEIGGGLSLSIGGADDDGEA